MKENPKYIPFVLNEIEDLEEELSQAFFQISLFYPNKSFLIEKVRWISSVTFWKNAKHGLRIRSQMYDVAERLEVGVLKFQIVEEPHPKETMNFLPKSFSQGTKLQKLVLEESNHRLESGLKIEASNGDSLIIVPNAMPFLLAVKCSGIELPHFEPEYGLEEYLVEDWKTGILSTPD